MSYIYIYVHITLYSIYSIYTHIYICEALKMGGSQSHQGCFNTESWSNNLIRGTPSLGNLDITTATIPQCLHCCY